MPKEIAFIDKNLRDYQTLVNDLPNDLEYLLIETDQAGLQQIADYLDGKTGYDGIHILSHGSNGLIQLGSTVYSADTIQNYRDQLYSIRDSLTENGDVLFYGNTLEPDPANLDFIDGFGWYTDSGVAASSNVTGNAAQSGDWVLESSYTSSYDDADETIVVAPLTFPNYTHTMAINYSAGQVIAGDASGGGGAKNYYGDGGDGGGGGGDNDTLTGTDYNDVIFGDGHGGGSGGGEHYTVSNNDPYSSMDDDVYRNGSGGAGGAGDDTLSGGAGDDIIFGDGYNGESKYSRSGSSFQGGYGGDGGFAKIIPELAGGNGQGSNYTPGYDTAGDGFDSSYGGQGGQFSGSDGQDGQTNQITLTDTNQYYWNLIKARLDTSNGYIYVRGATGSGNDTINGGAGNDYLFGGYGDDTFVFDINDVTTSDTDTINDWNYGTAPDRLLLLNNGQTLDQATLTQIRDTQTNEGDDRVLTYSDNGRQVKIVLKGEKDTVIGFSSDFQSLIEIPAPTFNNLDGNSTYTEAGAPVVIDNDVTITNVELDIFNDGAGDLNGSSITIARRYGANSDDSFGIVADAGTSNLSHGSELTYNDVTVGTVTNNQNGQLVLSFGENATTAIVQDIVRNITYQNTADELSGSSVDINYVFDDGKQTSNSSSNARVYFQGINDAPTVSATGDNETAAGGGAAVSVFSSTSIDPIENENIASVTFTVSGLADTDSEKLNYDGTTIDLLTDTSGSFINTATSGLISYMVAVSESTATVTFKGPNQNSASSSVFQNALDGMTYENTLGTSFTEGNRIFTLANVTDVGSNDGANNNSWAAGNITSTITVVNGDSPTARNATKAGTEDVPFTMTTAEIVAAQEVNANETLEYITISSISGGTLELTGAPTAGTASDASTLASAGILSAGSKVNINDLTLIQFTPTANSTTNGSVVYTVTDSGGDTSTAATLTITLESVEDAPTLTGITTTLTALEDTATNLITGTPVFADVDTTGDITVTLTATNTSATLTASDADNVVVGNSGTNAITLTGTATEINTFLQTASNMTYAGASNSTEQDTVTITVNDDEGGTGTAETITVNITAVNDEPVVSATGAGGNSINGAAIDLFNSTVIDVDSPDSGDLVNSVAFTVSGLQDGADETINLDSISIALTDGTTGTTTGGGSLGYSVVVSGTTATVTLTHEGIAEGTLEAMLDAMTYENTSGSFSEGDRVITITEVKDDGGTANSGDDTWSTEGISSTVTVVDGTKPTATNYTDSADEDTTVSLSATELPTGLDSGSQALEYITIDTSKVVGGTLSLDSAGTAGTSTVGGVTYNTTAGDLSGIVHINIADIGKLDFRPTANLAGTGAASFEWTIIDEGGQSSPTATYTLDLTNVADAPEGTDKTINIRTTQTHTFSSSDFGFSDVDTGDTLNRVQIYTQLANGGALTIDNGALSLSNVAVNNGDWVNVADLGNLVYNPSAAGTDTFTFSVEDGSTSNETDATPNTITLNVTTPPPPPAPAPEPEPEPEETQQVDGATVKVFTEEDEGGESIRVIQIDPVSDERDDTDTTTEQADVPLHFDGNNNNSAVTVVSLPSGVGINARENSTAHTKNKLVDLITMINDTAGDSESDREDMMSTGQRFLDSLDETEGTLWVNQVSLTTNRTTPPDSPIKVTGTASNASRSGYKEALVIDTRQLPSGTELDLEDIEFAVIIGNGVIIRGGAGDNVVFAGEGSQDIILGPEDDELHGGAGDDAIGSKGGADILYGDSGNDLVVGGMGADTLYGGTGDDVLQGGQSVQGQGTFAVNSAGELVTIFTPRDQDFSDTAGFSFVGDWYSHAVYLENGKAYTLELTQANMLNIEASGLMLQATDEFAFVAQSSQHLLTISSAYQVIFGVLPDGDVMNELAKSELSLEQIAEIGYKAWYAAQSSLFELYSPAIQVSEMVYNFTGTSDQALKTEAIAMLDAGSSWSELFLHLAQSEQTHAHLAGENGLIQLTNAVELAETSLATDISDDLLYGGDGNDILIGGHGSDLLDGGDGIDTVIQQHALADYIIELLADDSVTFTYQQDDYIEVDTLINIEFVQFGAQIIGINELIE